MSTPESTAEQPFEILIAEDSPTQAQRLEHLLRQHGYHVVVAINGRLALEAARRRKPTLIISDVVMPEMDGYELCDQIKSEPELADVPLILVTTLSDPQDVIRGLECRADNFILKPYDETYLLNRVRFVLANRDVKHSERAGMGVEIFFNGHRHFITADRLQILNLLLSTYDAAIQRNKDLRAAQERLRDLNAELEMANKELEAFSYSISHDLRAPVRAVSAFSQMLQEEHAKDLSGQGCQYLTHISNSAVQMSQMIESLLNLSRLGRRSLSTRRIRMAELVSQVLEEMRDQTKDREVEIRTVDLPDVTADPVLLKQVWSNYISNALKYTRKKAKAVIEIGGSTEGEESIFYVRDNGAGFNMKYADKLFGVFQRLHAANDFEGTGVGLSIVQRIVNRHGGRAWAVGKEGEGATFCFSLPHPGPARNVSSTPDSLADEP